MTAASESLQGGEGLGQTLLPTLTEKLGFLCDV